MAAFQREMEERQAEATLALHRKLKAALKGWRESDAALTQSEVRRQGQRS